MATEFGAYHLADNPDLYQPMKNNNFRLLIQGLENLQKIGADEVISNAQEVIDFSVSKFTPPSHGSKKLEYKRGNSSVNFAGETTWDNEPDLELNDWVGANGHSVLQSWRARVYDVDNDVIYNSTNYKVTAILAEYTGDNTMVRYWEIFGLWPEKVSEGTLDNESPGKLSLKAKMCYDRALLHYPD